MGGREIQESVWRARAVVSMCAVSGGLSLVAVAQPVPLPPLSPAAQAAGAVVTREAGPGGGFEFVTIGNQGGAGNAEVPPEYQSFPTPTPGLGRVDYEYRISRTEVTYGQYFDFVRAYAPFWSGTNTVEFLGLGIRLTGADPHDPASYTLRPGWNNAPAEMGWRFAARFCNWLHNDQGITLDAFQTGAYDATTFDDVNDNANRLPGARFALATQNEWTKAMYFDPNRFGPNLAGYWPWPTTQETQPIIGPPGMPGAQTGVGLGTPVFPIVSYPGVMSPWGVLDGSGSANEWLEGIPFENEQLRFIRGAAQRGNDIAFDNIRIFNINFRNADGLAGIRLVANVPSPASALSLLAFALVWTRRTR